MHRAMYRYQDFQFSTYCYIMDLEFADQLLVLGKDLIIFQVAPARVNEYASETGP